LPQLADWEVELYQQVTPNVPPAPPVHVDVQLDHGMVLEWDEPAGVIATPGHTAGSISLLFDRAKALVAGDAIASRAGTPMLGVFNADPEQARATFRRLAELDVELVCFGHGDPLLADAQAELTRAATQL
jgi:glyoxylase-like metal-dependent hydrolase (beta-lactamase superfamily II)